MHVELIKVECIAMLLDEEDYRAGQQYEITADLLRRYPDNFRDLAAQQAPQPAKLSADEEARAVQQGQQKYDTFREDWDHREVQTDIALAQERRRRSEEAQRQADAMLQEAQARAAQVPAPAPQEPRTPPAPAAPTDPPAQTQLAQPGGRAERLKHVTGK